MKTCKKCGSKLPNTFDFFYKEKGRTDGLMGKCKKCYMEDQRERKYGTDGYKRCKVCGKTFEKVSNFYLNKNSGDGFATRCKLCTKQKYDITGNSKKNKSSSPKQRIYLTEEERKEAKRLRDYNRYWEKKDEITLKRKIRRQNGYRYFSEKEKRSKVVRNQKRRANLKNLPNSFTLEQWEFCKISFDNKCCYCAAEKPLQQEHFIPVIKDGFLYI